MYNADIQRNNWSNETPSFTPYDTSFSPIFKGTREEFFKHMQSNKSLFDGSSVYSNISLINPTDSVADLDFAIQQKQWQALNDSLNTSNKTRLIGFDFETLRVGNPNSLDDFSAITELGITESIIGKRSVNSSNSHSIAFGINETQLSQYLTDIKKVKEHGLDSFDKSERAMIESELERLSRYSGNIENVFGMSHITNIGDVVTVKSLAPSQGLNLNAIERGLINLSVLGGISEDVYEKAVINAGYKNINPNVYSGVQKRFELAGLRTQTLNTNITASQTLKDRIVRFFDKESKKENTFIAGYNTNSFDLPIYKSMFGDNLSKSNTLDAYTAIQYISDNKDISIATQIAGQHGFTNTGAKRRASQEGIAQALGITFEDTAHNAASDTKVANEIIANKNFYNSQGLASLAAKSKTQVLNTFEPNENTVLYALNSIAFDKNGLDYLQNGSIYDVSGVQRGRYYSIGGIKQYKDGKVGVEFNTAASNTSESFVKVFDSLEDMQSSIKKNFLIDSTDNITQEAINLNDYIANADKARRNYEDLFSTRNITYNIGEKTYEGGYEKLNQYYKAYNITASELGGRDKINEYIIKDIAETDKYDDKIISALKQSFDIPDDKDVYKSLLRDFKASYGRIHDESSLIDYITSQLDVTDFNNYQKTIAAERMRDSLIEGIEAHSNEISHQYVKDVPSDMFLPSRRDLFAMDINMSGSLVNLDFQNRENAINVLTRNFYSKTGKNANSIQVANSMVKAVDNLYENGIVNLDFIIDFYKTAGVRNNDVLNSITEALEKQNMTSDEIAKEISKFKVHTIDEIQPRKLSEMLVSEIQTKYINPIMATGFNYTDFMKKDFSKFEGLSNKDSIINFMTHKAENITGSSVLFGARGNKYHATTPIRFSDGRISSFPSIGEIFKELNQDKSDSIQAKMNKIISGVSNIQTTLDRDEIRKQLISNLNYSEEAADEIDRMLFLNRKSGPFGLTTFKTNEKTDYITQFAYSGKSNEDAFILLNLNTDRDSNLAKVMETMGNTDLSFKEKINLIKDNNYAAVFQLPAINKTEIKIDKNAYNDSFFSLLGIDDKEMGYSFNTIRTGENGFQKMSQNHLSFYDHGIKSGENTLENLDIALTDDADMINSAYRKVRQSLLDISQDTSISTSEKYSKMTKIFRRAQNGVIVDMPGPSGYQSLFVDGKFQKVFAPNIADIMQSSQLDIQAFEILALETAKKDVLRKNTVMSDNILRLAGETTENSVEKLEKLIDRVKSGRSVSEEFDEYFLKHFASVPMGLENNYKITGPEADFTFIDYVKNRMDNGYVYSDKTKGIINWLSNNKDRISQIVKEKSTHDKKIALLDTTMFNQYGVFDSTIRPVNTQQPTAQKFLPDRVKAQLGQDTIDKLQIKIGYDAMTTQRAELADAFKNYDVANGIKYGQLEDGITANFKQMDSAQIISKFKKLDDNFDDVFESIYKDAATKFGISQDESKRLLQQAFDVMKNTSTNVYESRGILRASFANNDLFLSPNIRTVEINPIEDLQLDFLKNNKTYNEIINNNNYIKQGTTFVLSNGDIRKYNGPSGYITGSVEDFLATGKGHLIEEVQGVSSIKGFIGNEKFTAYTPEFDSFTNGIFRDVLGQGDTAKNAYIYYSDAIFDKVFGSNVSGVFDLPILKHSSFGIIEGNYLNRIFYNTNKYISETGDNALFTELDNIFIQAGSDGLRLINYKGNITYDQTQMNQSGAFGQVDNVLKEINRRALDTNDKYQNVWKTIVDEINESDKNQVFRGTIHRGINNESMGGAMNLDPRMEANFRSKFMEQIDDYFTLEEGWDKFNSVKKANGERVSVFNYIADKIYEESIEGLDSSKTPIDKAFGMKRASALNTVKGIELSTQYMNAPETLQNSNLILDISLDNINIAPSGSDASELTKTGIYKLIDGKEVKYSDQIEQIAKAQGKDINNIAALRINLGDGIAFDNFGIKENGKLIDKKIGQLIVPLYDITPFKGEVQYTQTIRDLNNVLQIAKDYGKKNGLEQSKKNLNEAVKKLYITLASDLDYSNKKSYIVSKTLKIPMKNSGMLHADSTIVPTVNAITNNYSAWLDKSNSAMREEIIQAVREGNINYDIDIASTGLTGRKYTTIKDGKLYYDDIVEMGKEGFIQKGVDFKETGIDLYLNTEKYKPYINDDLFNKFNSSIKDTVNYKNLNTDEIIGLTYLRGDNFKEEYKYLNEIIRSKKNTKNKRNYFNSIVESETRDLVDYYKGYYGTDTLSSDIIEEINKKATKEARNHIKELEKDLNVLDSMFEKVTENYLENVGTFGLAARYPTFMEDSVNTAIFRLNKDLRKDEMVVTGALGHRLNMDHDGDKGVVKLMLGEKGKLLSRAENKLYSAFSKAYEMQVYNLRNNEIMADLIKKSSDKINESVTRVINGKEYGSAVDFITDTINMRKAAISNTMQETTRNELLTELKLDRLIGIDVSEYTPEEINTVFNAWDKKYGNMIKNMETNAAAIKAKITKGEIGTVSNINYTVNQVLYESMKEALENGDRESKAKYNRIKTDLHIGNMGLLPETEQKAIDVKHSYQGLSISETRKYNQGIIELFKGNTENGQQLIRQAMGSKFEEEKLNKFIGSITELSQDNRARTKFNYRAPKTINGINAALDYIEQIQNYVNYAQKNGIKNDTAIKSVYNTMLELQNSFNMGYYHNDALQAIYEDAVFISTKDGNPILYRLNKIETDNDFIHSISFDTFDLNNGTISKGLPDWTPKGTVISGTAPEIQSKLQSKFGNFRGYSMAEVTGDIRGFRRQINKLVSDSNVNKFAQMYSRGNTNMAMKFLSDLESNTLNKSNKTTIKKINSYMSSVNQEDFIDFINKAEFIRNNPRYQKENAFKNLGAIDDLLTDINRQIIQRGKNRQTSTSVIFDDTLKKIANDVGLSKINTLEYQQFVNTNPRATADVFKGYEEKIIDIQKASKDFASYTNVKDEAEKILNKYRKYNNDYISSLNIKASTTSDLDTIFNWNSSNLEDMRVGINTENGLYGRRFSDLTKADIDEILNFTNRGEDTLSKHAYDTTKDRLLQFVESKNGKITSINGLQGASHNDIISLKELNEKILQEGAEAATEEGLNASGKKIAKEYAGDLFKKTLNGAKEFAKTTPGKITMGLAALGLVSNIMSSGDTESPLAPELNHKDSTGPINNNSLSQKAPSSNTGRKTIYTDSSSGLQFKMSAKSKNKINQMDMARQLSAQTGGDTNINVYDDRSQVSSNWLERKFSELV